MDRPLRVGLTGGIACGKSTVAKLFAEYGIPIIDTDVIARQLVQPGAPALDEIHRWLRERPTTGETTGADEKTDDTEEKPAEGKTEEKPAEDETEDKAAGGKTEEKPAEDETEEIPAEDETEDKAAVDETEEKPAGDETEDKAAGDEKDES